MKAPRSCKRRINVSDTVCKPRRSARIACKAKKLGMFEAFTVADLRGFSTVFRQSQDSGSQKVTDDQGEEEKASNVQKARAPGMDKEEFKKVDQDFSSKSSESEYQMESNIDGHDEDSFLRTGETSASADDHRKRNASLLCLDSLKTMTPEDFGTQFQEVVIRALMQSSGTVIGSSPSTGSQGKGGPSGGELLSRGDRSPPSTWNEGTFNKATAQWKRKPPMTRTSAGEDTDSQEEFLIPQNESPQEKSQQIRRLNRSRSRKAKDLTSNRKAMKKLPYVIHIDGIGRAKGIHKHLWRAAVRGQCGRLDPTMDNINHHAKHVVDSIWHALEKEWEFEGYAHRAREMFERCGTKFMRNRKMQLKRKCKTNRDGAKPNDVSPIHWAKILHLTKESSKQGKCSASIHSTSEEKKSNSEVLQEGNDQALLLQGISQRSRSTSPKSRSIATEHVLPDEENVEVKIRRLRNELLRLQQSTENRQRPAKEVHECEAPWNGKFDILCDVAGEYNGMKENMKPRNVNGDLSSTNFFDTSRRTGGEEVERVQSFAGEKNKSALLAERGPTIIKPQGGEEVVAMEVECGDLVSLIAFSGGTKKEIGKAIIMGLASSKYARKVIPKGWHLVKVYTYTAVGASEVCPFPAGWAEQVKHETLKDAKGRNILWPESLLGM